MGLSQLYTYIGLLGIISLVGILFRKTTIPIGLILVVVGMILSLFKQIPHVALDPQLVLTIFLPVIVYQASAYTPLREIKKYRRAIELLSVGHVFFITGLVAITVHLLIPQYGWPLAFLLGAIISPPDDVAIITIAEKINLPQRLIIILESEGMLNDATALILFRFSLAAMITHQFSIFMAVTDFFIIVIAETCYGVLLAYIIGNLRVKFTDPTLQVTVSILTPFLAYIPAQQLGGSGVLATVVTGLVIGNFFLGRFTPEIRIVGRAVWITIAFVLQNILFLLVGFDFRIIVERISFISYGVLLWYTLVVIFVLIIGRFIWIFTSVNLQRLKFLRPKNYIFPPWQYLFVVSWAGMRGGVSLAAALAVPSILLADGSNVRDFIVFIVFSCIIATLLIQGLTLPWVMKRLGVHHHKRKEEHSEYISELSARVSIIKASLNWLRKYMKSIKNDPDLSAQIHLHIEQYQLLKKQLIEKIKNHSDSIDHVARSELRIEILLASQLRDVERAELDRLWQSEEISYAVKLKLLQQLDFRDSQLI
jgi:Na+/H+ antiporter